MFLSCINKRKYKEDFQESLLNRSDLAAKCEKLMLDENPKVVALANATIQMCKAAQERKQKLTLQNFLVEMKKTARQTWDKSIQRNQYEIDCIEALHEYEREWVPALEKIETIATDHLGGHETNRTALAERCKTESETTDDQKMLTLALSMGELCKEKRRCKRRFSLPGLKPRI